MTRKGFTLVELLVGTLLLVGGGGALLMGMQYAMIHAEFLSQFQAVLNAAQGALDELSARDFDALRAEAQANPTGRLACVGEDANCNGVLDANEDLNVNGVLDAVRLAIQIRPFPPAALDPSLLDLHVAACWESRGRRIGEDQNCNGLLELGEDTNGNGWVDSLAMVSTRVARTK